MYKIFKVYTIIIFKMHEDDEYGPPTELKQILDKITRKYQKKLASNGSQGSGCGCNIRKKKSYYNLENLDTFTRCYLVVISKKNPIII